MTVDELFKWFMDSGGTGFMGVKIKRSEERKEWDVIVSHACYGSSIIKDGTSAGLVECLTDEELNKDPNALSVKLKKCMQDIDRWKNERSKT